MINLNNYSTVCSEITGNIVTDSLMEYINQGGIVFPATWFELKINRTIMYGAISPADTTFELEFYLNDNPIMIEDKNFGSIVFRCNNKLYWVTIGAKLI
jgi:hypothetical protein